MRFILIFLIISLQFCEIFGLYEDCPGQIFELNIKTDYTSPQPFSKKTVNYTPISYLDLYEITSLVYDPTEPRFLFTKKGSPHRIYIIKFGFSSWHPITYLEYGNENFKEIAFDSITRNFYYISEDFAIGVCDPKLEKCIRLNEPINKSNSFSRTNLILNSKVGKMYWIERTDPYISKVNGSNMNGTNFVELFEKPSDQRSYSTYEKIVNNISTIVLNKDQTIVYVSTQNNIFKFHSEAAKSLNFFRLIEDYGIGSQSYYGPNKVNVSMFYLNCKLYYLDRDANFLTVYNKNGKRSTYSSPYGLMFTKPYRIVDQEPMPENPCALLECEGICIISHSEEGKEAKCLIENGESDSVLYLISAIVLIFLILIIIIISILAIKCGFFPALRNRIFGAKRYVVDDLPQNGLNSKFYVDINNYY